MSHIEVNLLYLENLATRTREVETALRQFSALAGCSLNSSPKVEGAYRDLSDRWDQRRNELADALSIVAEGFDTTRREFERTDQTLANELSGESMGGAP